MARRICPCRGCTAHPGSCPTIVTSGRCLPCSRAHDTARGTTDQRGYGTVHQRERRRWARIIRRRPVPCVRQCGRLIRHSDTWHLDHTDDRTGYLGPSCAPCNLAAAGRASHGTITT